MASNATIGILRALLTADTSQFDAAMAGSAKNINTWSANFAKFGLSAQQIGEVAVNELTRSSAAIDKFAKQFSGADIAKKADEMAGAIQRIGGASTLTAGEQAKVNAVVTEAIAKYEALGQTAPKHLTDLAAATAQVEEKTSFLDSTFAKLTASFSASALIDRATSSLIAMGKSAFDNASTLVDMSEKSGISIEMLQVLQSAAAQTGGTIEGFTAAIDKLGINITNGSKQAREAIKELGLEYTNIRQMKPEEQFSTIADALSHVESEQERNSIGLALFGKKWEEIAPAVIEGWKKIADGVSVASDAQVRALDQLGDEWAKFERNAENRLVALLGSYVVLGKYLADNPLKLAVSLATASASPNNIDPISLAIDAANRSQSGTAKKPAAKDINLPLAGGDDFTSQLAKMQAALDALTPATKKQIDAALELQKVGQTTYDKIDDKLNLTTGLTEFYAQAQQKAAEASRKAAEAAKEHQANLAEVSAAMKNGLTLSDMLNTSTDGRIVLLAKQQVSEKAIADVLGVNIVTVKEVIASDKEATSAAQKRQKAIDDLNSSSAQLTDTQYGQINALLILGKSEDEIAVALGFTKQQVHDVAVEEKRRADAAKQNGDDIKKAIQVALDAMLKYHAELDKNTQIETAADADADKLRMQRTLSTYAFQKAQIDLWVADQKAKVNTNVDNWQKAYDAIDRDAEEKMKALGTATDRMFEGIDSALSTLANAGGGEISKIAGYLQTAVGSAMQFAKALEAAGKQGATTAENISTYATIIGGVIQGTYALGNAVAAHDDAVNQQKVTKELSDQFGVDAAQSLITQIRNTPVPADLFKLPQSSNVFSPDYAANANLYQKLVNLPDIINAAGPLTSSSLQTFETQAQGLFQFIKLGGAAGQAAMTALTGSVALFAAQADKTGGLWDSAFQDIIKQSKDAGLSIDGITQAIAGQQTKLGGAVGSTIAGFSSEYADTIKQIQSAQATIAGGASGSDLDTANQTIATLRAGAAGAGDEFDRLSRIALGSFNTLIASGMSADQAIAAIGPGIDGLIADASALGLTGNSAFQELSRWRTLTTQFAPVVAEAGSLNDVLTATANLGGLTADSFADIQAQGESTYNQLIADGFTQQEAEKEIAPLIQNEIQLHKDKGLAIDDATQAIIDQMTADGTLSEQQESTQDVLKEGFSALLTALNVDLPAGWKKLSDDSATAAGNAQKSLDGIKPPTLHLPVVVDSPDFTPSGQDLPIPDNPRPDLGFAGGTYGMYQDFGTGTPVMLHGRERVMTSDEGGGSVHFHLSVDAMDAASFQGFLERGGADAILQHFEDNRGAGAPVSPRTRLQRVAATP